MELQARGQIGEKGRIVIPAEIREALGIRVGDKIIFRVEDDELRISTLRKTAFAVHRSAQQICQTWNSRLR